MKKALLSRRSFLAFGAVAAVGTGTFYVSRHSRWQDGVGTVMTPPQAYAAAKAGGILLVDIRRPDEWEKTGVPASAMRIDMRDKDFIDKLELMRSSSVQPVALICARGVRSRRMTRRLSDVGIGPIIDVPEGMLGSDAGPGWIQRDLPVIF